MTFEKEITPMSTTTKDNKSIDYSSYLQLDKILDAQGCLSKAHDEMLFISVHQTYEIWFKQILFELDRVQNHFSAKSVKETHIRDITASLTRITEILHLLSKQLDILEQMTPLDFLDFRNVFRNASGFQSLQFREFEIRLGLEPEKRIRYAGKCYDSYLKPSAQNKVKKIESKTNLVDQLDEWLGRTPFVKMHDYDFWGSYESAVEKMIAADLTAVASDTSLTPEYQDLETQKIKTTRQRFQDLFDQKNNQNWRLSPKAIHAALFINLYRDQPALQGPFSILRRLMDIDELLTLWRFRHALMVQRMLGLKMGSGGSSGHNYLMETVVKHRIFDDLFGLSTYLIPRSALPALPDHIQEHMRFVYECVDP